MKLFSSAAFFLLHLCKNVLTTEFCNGVGPGDIMVTGFNMNNPDEVLMVVLEPIEAGGTFYMTDRPWDGTAFLELENDGTLQVCVCVMRAFGQLQSHRKNVADTH
jgi:hypothetical protein